MSAPLPGTGVTPSAAKTCALRIWGVRSHMPPVAPCGNRSRRDTFQASLSPVFWTSMPKLPHCPRFSVAGPVPVVTKTGPATMHLGQWGNFGIDVQNTGLSDAWNVSLRDLLPQGATGGMCDLTPQILSAQVFAADGVTPVPGKGPLNPGSGYSLGYSGAPNCQLDLTMLTAAGRIGPNERLIIRYRTQLDAKTQNGVTLTNVAGAIQWFNGDTSSTGGTQGTGVIDVRNLSLPVNGEVLIQFDITLKPAIANGTVVTNQATLSLASGTTFAWSDDPNVNGTADPTVSGGEDPTRVTIVLAASDPALVVTKTGLATMNLGQWGNFGIDVQNTGLGDASNVSLRDLLPRGATGGGMCNLTPEILSAQVFAADGVTPIPGK